MSYSEETKGGDKDEISELMLSLIEDGKNIFLTGSGGVGKSYYVKKLKEELKGKKRIAITSTTGVSSYFLGGQTIHSFSGIGAFKGTESFETVIKKVHKTKAAKENWKNFDIIVIDEISMLGSKMLEMLDKIARYFREDDLPFGGIQVIFTGDFLQLPPIQDSFAFLGKTWDTLDLQIIYLKKMYRFTDEVYAKMLERVRMAKHTQEDINLLQSRKKAYDENKEKWEGYQPGEDGTDVLPTFMFSKKASVDEKNNAEMAKNPNKLMCFNPIFTEVKHTNEVRKKIEKEQDNPENVLYLKVGAQVMLNVNIDVEDGLVNGSRGVVTKYNDDSGNLYVKFLDGREIPFTRHEYTYEEEGKVWYHISQYPFMLAYALSIHKTQGSTLDYAIIDLGYSVFEDSMCYVALSRVRSLEGLFLKAFQPSRITTNKHALNFYEELEENWE